MDEVLSLLFADDDNDDNSSRQEEEESSMIVLSLSSGDDDIDLAPPLPPVPPMDDYCTDTMHELCYDGTATPAIHVSAATVARAHSLICTESTELMDSGAEEVYLFWLIRSARRCSASPMYWHRFAVCTSTGAQMILQKRFAPHDDVSARTWAIIANNALYLHDDCRARSRQERSQIARFAVDYWMFILVHSGHYVCLLVMRQERRVVLFDSLESDDGSMVVQAALQVVGRLDAIGLLLPDTVLQRAPAQPVQLDVWECGFHVMQVLSRLLNPARELSSMSERVDRCFAHGAAFCDPLMRPIKGLLRTLSI
jgi:hypothetical protein